MKKFSEFKIVKTNEAEEITQANLPENVNAPDESTGEVKIEADVEEKTECDPAKLFSKLFESREMAHIYHLQVRGDEGSYAAHMALGSFYESVLDLADEIIEVYQGQYGIVEDYDVIDTKETKTKDKLEYFEDLVKFIKDERKCINSDDTHLHNIIDEVVALVYKTIYKLKFNK